LHAIAGIPSKPNNDPIKLDDLLGHRITFASMSQLCLIVPCFLLVAYRNCPVDWVFRCRYRWAVNDSYRIAESDDTVVRVMNIGLACCALEIGSAITQGLLIPAGDPRPDDRHVLLISGTVTNLLAPAVAAAWQELPEPKAAVSFGACANTGGPYWDAPTVLPGVDEVIDISVYVPGCPPTPQALIAGLAHLAGAAP
jgi:NADH-quinone oxidoreductase subunit B